MKGRRMVMVVAGLGILGLVALAVVVIVMKEGRVRVATQLPGLESIPDDQWRVLSEKRVFFGHQSVGENIIDGMIEVMKDKPKIKLNIVESKNVESANHGIFYHHKIGRNTRPKSKFRAYKRIIESSKDSPIDIVVMKLCYIDLNYESDPRAVFEDYSSTISALEEKFPNTVFVHSTSPIESRTSSVQRALKEIVKSVIGRPSVVENNRIRQRYNELLRSHYSDNEPIFDIARSEATSPDGSMVYRSVRSDRVFLMDGRYSNDGGHLNQLGRRRVAEQFLIALARAASQSKPAELNDIDE